MNICDCGHGREWHEEEHMTSDLKYWCMHNTDLKLAEWHKIKSFDCTCRNFERSFKTILEEARLSK